MLCLCGPICRLYMYVSTIVRLSHTHLYTVSHCIQAIRSRAWWIFPTVVIAGAAEVAGWAARLISSNDPSSMTPFIIQCVFQSSPFVRLMFTVFRTTVLVLAPTPFVAALFVGFGRISARVGPQYSRLSPAMCESRYPSSCLAEIQQFNQIPRFS